MFGFDWTQIGLIGVVALVLIGPKDLPVAIKAVSGMIKKARRMAAEFQSHVDDMVKDTELAELRQQVSELRRFDIRTEVERTVDRDGTLRSAFDLPDISGATPFTPAPDITAPDITAAGAAHEAGTVEVAPPERHDAAAPGTAAEAPGTAPAFVPPAEQVHAAAPGASAEPGPPAFIPPSASHL